MTSLGEAFPIALKRAKEVLEQYKALGAAGSFGAFMIAKDIQAAEQALASGDVVKMIAAYINIKDVE